MSDGTISGSIGDLLSNLDKFETWQKLFPVILAAGALALAASFGSRLGWSATDRAIRSGRANKRGIKLIEDVPRVVRSCPTCGSSDYLVQTDTATGQIECQAITCKSCGADILDAYRRTAS